VDPAATPSGSGSDATGATGATVARADGVVGAAATGGVVVEAAGAVELLVGVADGTSSGVVELCDGVALAGPATPMTECSWAR
jgi:hypothetical protein